MMRHMIMPINLMLLLLLLGMVLQPADAHMEDAYGADAGELLPQVSVGILQRAPSCTDAQRIPSGAHVTVDLRLFTDFGKGNRKEVLYRTDKIVSDIGSAASLPGLEFGLLGACVGETRTIRIPAPLGFGAEGNAKLNVPPDTPLRATVVVKSFRVPSEAEAEAFAMDEDFGSPMSPAEAEEGVAFAEEVVQLDDTSFDAEMKGKHAFVLLHAPWCHACISFKPVFNTVAKTCAGQKDIMVVAVDATANSMLAERFGVEAFPTILLLKATGEIAPYEDERTTEGVISFLNGQLRKNIAAL